jgi:hypothetical protein
MRHREWPAFAKLRSQSIDVGAHSRGGENRGGHYAFERAPGARFLGTVAVPPMRISDALRFRAFLHSLRGRAGSFRLRMPSVSDAPASTPNPFGAGYALGKITYTDAFYFSDGTQYSDTYDQYASSVTGSATIAALSVKGASQMALTSITVPSALIAGNYATISDASGTQLLRITSIAGATVDVRPRLRRDFAAGAQFAFGRVTAEFRLTGAAPVVPLLVGGRSAEVQVEIEEAY